MALKMAVTPPKDRLLVAAVLSVSAVRLSVCCPEMGTRTHAESLSGIKDPPSLRNDSVEMSAVSDLSTLSKVEVLNQG